MSKQPTLLRLLGRARQMAEQALPDEVKDAASRLRDRVVQAAPAPLAAAIERITARAEAEPDAAAAPEPAPAVEPSATVTTASATPPAPEPSPRSDRASVLERVHARAEHGLKPEDTMVVIYATEREADAVAAIAALFDGIETTVRVMDLDREPPQTKRQLAGLTDVMVPPYVYINGRYWGGQYELTALAGDGELALVVSNRLDELSAESRRIGKLHDSVSDDITVDNILRRWHAGHILCVDDLDAWLERDKHGHEHFYYQGGEHSPDEMPRVAAEIVASVEAGRYEAKWLFDPIVHVH